MAPGWRSAPAHVDLDMLRREAFRYSITCRSADEAVLHCLKALADFAEGGGHKRSAWVDAAVAAWDRDQDLVTLRFTTQSNRDAFRRKARELLGGRWAEYAVRDSDPPPALGAKRPGEGGGAIRPPADGGIPSRPEFPFLG